jgi:hypothetical protein
MTKTVHNIFSPPPAHFVGDGFRVHNFIPGIDELTMRRMDPFILLDYNSVFYFPPSETKRGVGMHPHRGFETVTIAYKGRVAHRDNAGNSGVIRERDVQWMTAGAGILHEEYHEESYSKEGGNFQMVQLWINLPAADKYHKPKYQAIENKNITTKELGDNARLEIISGEYDGLRGPAATFSPVILIRVIIKGGKSATLQLEKSYNTALIVISGDVKVNGEEAPENSFVLFNNNGTDFTVDSPGSDAEVLLLSGKPLGEPIAAAGPFVMNTREELIRAFDDYEKGRF